MEPFQKLAVAALISVIVLIFVGAIVRATGSGLGCPDWPTCWGRLVPPTSAEQVDFSKIDLEKFRRKAARFGRDPDSITRESLRNEFNPVHTWVEYVNRLCTMPVGILTLATFVAAFWQLRRRPAVWWAACGAFVLVLVNAELGRRVVMSGLQPGIITLHMVLAIILLCLLVFVAWRGRERPWQRLLGAEPGNRRVGLWLLGVLVFLLTVAEGVMGAQVRELTDELARSHAAEPRSAWTQELEGSPIYLIHRSFSWLIVIVTAIFLALGRRRFPGGLNWLEKAIGILVFSLLVMGVLLAHVGVLHVVQVLHVGAAALLIAALFFWLLATRRVAA